MTFAFGKNNRKNFENTIKNRQQAFNRFNKRFNAARTPTEKSFLKAEIARCKKDLNQFAVDWKKIGFGNPNWITKKFTNKMLSPAGKWITVTNTTSKTTGKTATSARNNNTRTSASSRRPSTTNSRTSTSTRTSAGRSNTTRTSSRRAVGSRSTSRIFSSAR